MKRRKQKLSIYDIGRLPTAPVNKTSGYQTRSGFYAAEKAAEQAAIAAPFVKAQEEIRAACAEITRRVKAFYSQPLDEMGTFPVAVVPTDYVRPEGSDFEQRTAPRDRETEWKAYLAFWESVNERGIQISRDGYQRLGSWVAAIAENENVLATPVVWETGLERLSFLGCFAAGEVEGYRPPVKSQPTVTEQPASIDNLSTEHREQRQQALQIVGNQWGEEFTKIFLLWTESLREKWDYVLPVDELGPKVAQYIERWNLSPFNRATYDRIRVVFSRLGLFRTSDGQVLDLRLPEDILADQIEEADLGNRDVRQDFNFRSQQIRNN